MKVIFLLTSPQSIHIEAENCRIVESIDYKRVEEN